MAETVYALCMLTCLLCTVLLGRAWARSRARILLWSTLCFGLLTVNNLLLFTDLVLLPQVDLALPRNATALAGVSLLVFGLIWDS